MGQGTRKSELKQRRQRRKKAVKLKEKQKLSGTKA
jgi:hypothetical protein